MSKRYAASRDEHARRRWKHGPRAGWDRARRETVESHSEDGAAPAARGLSAKGRRPMPVGTSPAGAKSTLRLMYRGELRH